MSISPGSEAKELQRLPGLKYYNVMKWETRLNWGFNVAKITNYIKKMHSTKIDIISIFDSVEP